MTAFSKLSWENPNVSDSFPIREVTIHVPRASFNRQNQTARNRPPGPPLGPPPGPLPLNATQNTLHPTPMVSLAAGEPTRRLAHFASLAPWANAWPFGVLSRASFPGLPKTELPPHTPIILCYITYNRVIMNPSVILVAKIAWLLEDYLLYSIKLLTVDPLFTRGHHR